MNTIEERNKIAEFLFSTSRRYEIIIFSFQLSTQCAIFFFFHFFQTRNDDGRKRRKIQKYGVQYIQLKEKKEKQKIFFFFYEFQATDFRLRHHTFM